MNENFQTFLSFQFSNSLFHDEKNTKQTSSH